VSKRVFHSNMLTGYLVTDPSNLGEQGIFPRRRYLRRRRWFLHFWWCK